MEFEIGMVVKSIAGRDAGRFYIVTEILNNRVCVADGKLRKIEHPKEKNPIHLNRSGKVVDLSNFKTNKALKSFLKNYNK